MATEERLALVGGEKAVQLPFPEWPRKTQEDADALLAAFWGTGREAIEPGGVIGALERAFAAYQGRRYAMATNGGTAALALAVLASGAGPGDEVIVSPYTWGATVGCILHAGAIPVFADIAPDTLNLDPAAVASKITPRTRAVVVVHIYGQPADMDPILEVAHGRGLAVIEDCAQAHGATYRGRKVGSIGDIGCFSFQASKHVPVGEGGILVTDDEAFYHQALMYGTHPQRQGPETAGKPYAKYVDSVGYNYRIHPYAAALGNARLPSLDGDNERRRERVGRLIEALRGVPGIEPVFPRVEAGQTYHMIPFRYRGDQLGGLPREKYREMVQAEGVRLASYVSVPIHLRPRFQEHRFFAKGYPWASAETPVVYRPGDCPVAERFCSEQELTLYSTPLCDASDELIDQIAHAFVKVARGHEQLLVGARSAE
ncbi:MAG TPA: DegT/DnrJ/EryC1/StrS family aminotransferase [Chloroflexota bacterium]|nr:DegT/DnrJ/EryC1/StrS family aminotransferase [Chloroflexota bacterium]